MDYEKMLPIYGLLIVICLAVSSLAIALTAPAPTHPMCDPLSALPWLTCQN